MCHGRCVSPAPSATRLRRVVETGQGEGTVNPQEMRRSQQSENTALPGIQNAGADTGSLYQDGQMS